MMKTASTEISLLKGVQWVEGHEGYDPQLPGYHLTGDIASIRLVLLNGARPSKLVLSLQTSPGMPPNLEGFTVSTSTCMLYTAYGLELVEIRGVDGAYPSTTVFEPQQMYFGFQIVGNAIQVTFLPKAIELLKTECIISWVDWYR